MHVYLRQHLDGCPGFSCFGQIRHTPIDEQTTYAVHALTMLSRFQWV